MVQIEDLGRTIDEHPFFRGIGTELRALLIGCAANERVEGGQFLFRQGEPADKFYLIRYGTLAIQIQAPGRPPVTLETVGEGEVVGWSWLVEPHRWTFDARANTLLRVLSFDAKCLRGKMESDPVLGYEVLRRFVPLLGQRLAAARLQLLDLYGPPRKA
jgi:CRP/FNR family cyclic AMP-dependent transcriptional regulator